MNSRLHEGGPVGAEVHAQKPRDEDQQDFGYKDPINPCDNWSWKTVSGGDEKTD